jgi:hypothetical protein
VILQGKNYIFLFYECTMNMLYNGFTNGPQEETALFKLLLNWALNLDVHSTL